MSADLAARFGAYKRKNYGHHFFVSATDAFSSELEKKRMRAKPSSVENDLVTYASLLEPDYSTSDPAVLFGPKKKAMVVNYTVPTAEAPGYYDVCFFFNYLIILYCYVHAY